MEFSEFKLHPDLERGIAEAGYITCMPVQKQVLTCAFGGQDLYVQSQTGTGKTAAFLIVIFQRLLTEAMLTGKKAIIMVPTRELAVQVEEEAKTLGKYLPYKVGSFYGGVGYAQQQRLLRDNVQILVGTPGRVLDLNKSGHMNLMEIAFLVLDEADRMFDMGFYPDLRKLIRVVPPADRRQTMLFSATLNTWVKNLAWEYTKNPKEIEIEPETVTVEEVEQLLYHVPSEDKMKLLLGIMEREKPESAIVFCNTKRYAEIAAKRLRLNGIECEYIMGDLPQVKRLKIIDDVKAGRTRFLVATDVAARGLDIEGLALVVNYDLPVEAENYVHRIGRTARAGKTGKAYTLASEQDVYELPDIEKYIGKKIPSKIAEVSLYGEDKSEGVRIKTDFYDDRERGRPEGREGRGIGRSRDNSRSRSQGSHRDTGRSATGGRSTGGGRSDGRSADRSRRNATQNSSGRPKGGTGRNNDRYSKEQREQTQEFASLSFEERMAHYKEKYGSKSGVPDMSSMSGIPGTPVGTEEQSIRRNKKGRSQDKRRRKRQESAPAGGSPAGGSPDTQSPAVEAKPKQGIIGKLLGIFGKR
jgi:ATP-dependent RNA helicase RhlB